jgi:hypothetical protein
LVLTWTSTDATLTCFVQRTLKDAEDWTSLSGWLDAGSYTYTDADRESGATYQYRLRVVDAQGRGNNAYQVLEA